VIRPIAPDALDQLRRAALMTDVALDLALMRVGVLAPADLSEIRAELIRPGLALRASRNRDGHGVVEFVRDGAVVASLQPDGRVVPGSLTSAV
jgi:hypothetical protein